MRAFLAIVLPASVREHLARVQNALSPRIGKVSFTKTESLHITLKFLGEVRDQELTKVIESLGAVRSSGEIRLAAERIDCFPNRGPVRIIAAIFSGSEETLTGIHSAIEQRCEHLGFAREQRKYNAHATLARARPTLLPSTRELASREMDDFFPGPDFDVSEFVLMQSTLRPAGAEYAVVARFPLLSSK